MRGSALTFGDVPVSGDLLGPATPWYPETSLHVVIVWCGDLQVSWFLGVVTSVCGHAGALPGALVQYPERVSVLCRASAGGGGSGGDLETKLGDSETGPGIRSRTGAS